MANVLMVDDDYLDAMSVQRSFRKANIHHDLIIARNGIEALKMLRGQEVDKIEPAPIVILLDLNMPKMNGIEFLKEIRGNPEFSRMHVFVMTTSSEEIDKQEALQLGIQGYIVKPLNFDDFSNQTSSMDSFNLLCELLKN
jgi:CheY-like chemotaxis protein